MKRDLLWRIALIIAMLAVLCAAPAFMAKAHYKQEVPHAVK